MCECAHIRPHALCRAAGFLKSINLKVLSPQYTRGGGHKEAKSVVITYWLFIDFSLLCLAYGFHALCRAAGFLKSINLKVLSPQYTRGGSHKEAKSVVITYWLFIDFSLLCLAHGFHALCRAAGFLKSINLKVLSPQYTRGRSHKEAKYIIITYWLFIDFSLLCLAYVVCFTKDFFFWQSQTFDLKALTDHFGGGSRVVSFDPYS
jgi:hypothetical protein